MLKIKIKKMIIFFVMLFLTAPPVISGMLIINKIEAASAGRSISDLRRDIDNSQRIIANNTNQRKEYDRQIANAKNEQKQSEQMKEWYDRLIMTIQEEMDAQEELIKLQEEYLVYTADRIEEKQADYEQSYEWFLELLLFTYKRGTAGHLELFLRADNLSALLTQIDRMAEMANYTKDILTNLQNDRIEIEQSRETYEKSNVQLEEYRTELGEKASDFKEKQDEADRYIHSLDLSIAEWEDKQRQIDRDQQAIQNEITQALRDIQAREAAANQQRAYAGGKMEWPVELRFKIVTSPYGQRIHPITRRSEFHRGVDISGAGINGTPIRAANDGKVIISQSSGSYGNYIVIDHGAGHTTLYSHATRLLKKVGDEVKRGETIATVGSTGWSTGPHLHFEVAVGGATQNPIGNGWIVVP